MYLQFIATIEMLNDWTFQLLNKNFSDFSANGYELVKEIYNSVENIGIAFVIILFTFEIGRMSFEKSGDIDIMYMSSKLVKLIISIVVISNGLIVLEGIQDIGSSIANEINNTGQYAFIVELQEFVNRYEQLGFIERMQAFFIFSLISVANMIAIGIIYFIAISRMFEMAILSAFAPIPLSTFVSKELDSVGKSFIKSYIGVCLKSSVILFILKLYTIISMENFVTDSVLQQLCSIIILSGLVFSSSKFTDKIIG